MLQDCRDLLRDGKSAMEARRLERNELEKQTEIASTSLMEDLLRKADIARKLTEKAQGTNVLRQTREELAEEERNLEHKLKTIPGMRPVLAGHESIMKVLGRSSKRLQDGYYGMVVDNFGCPDKMTTAVDETAGMKLFNHVVETDKIATELLAELNKQKLPGVFNFMPLNRIRARQYDYSMVDSKDAFPIKEKLEYDDDLGGIMSFVFGKTLVCRSMDIAVRLARTSSLDCITLDGEKSSSKGVLSGGYISRERSKMANYTRYQTAVGKHADVVQEIEQGEEEIGRLEEELGLVSGEVERNQNLLARYESILGKLVANIKVMLDDDKDLERKCLEEDLRRGKMITDQKLMEATLSGFRQELEVDINSQLTLEEKHKCDILVKKIENVRSDYKKQCSVTDELESEKTGIEGKMVGVRRDVEELVGEIRKVSKMDNEMEVARLELDAASLLLKKELKRLDVVAAKELKYNEEIKTVQGEVEVKETNLAELREELGEESRRKEKLFERKLHLQNSIKKLSTKLNSLGGVQPEVLEEYQDGSRNMLGKKLQKIQKKLKKFDNVNKKALDQFLTFTEENARLVERQNLLMEDKTRILNMINVLDTKKNEQILYTYKQLYKNFKQVFSSLVLGGQGQLILTGGTEGETEADKMENAVGLTTTVSFSGGQAMKSLDQLSGGQKSVVALAFILAIQKCDPAPFYLFDEVDAALDIEHRRAVAAVIHSQAGEAQFITTTFRPEMLRSADRCFGVMFRGKASHVVAVGKEEAEDFVHDDDIQN
eukprot:GFUD01042533.1.p1 GENE.GFUD01042533.1~~GFUD01042533.1.p1  ORF type:complete len:863 (+),score=306.67 GFUD01042533.1:271-2589(+)